MSQGYRCEHAYIAAQGPLDDTVNDLWRMIYQTDCRTIVMLCNVIEQNFPNCAKYWPNPHQKIRYGAVTVKGIDSRHLGDFERRLFEMKKVRHGVHIVSDTC